MTFLAETGSFYATLFISLGAIVVMLFAGVKITDLAKKHGANFWIVVFIVFVLIYLALVTTNHIPSESPNDADYPTWLR